MPVKQGGEAGKECDVKDKKYIKTIKKEILYIILKEEKKISK